MSLALFGAASAIEVLHSDEVFVCPEVLCADGSTPTERGVAPLVNGCGPQFADKLLPKMPGVLFNECCNSHDVCYETAGSDREQCDQELDGCMKQKCSSMNWLKRAGCNVLRAAITKSMTTSLACDAFQTSQIRVGCPEGASP
eukprot:TRINITY_DN2773_c0_g1_i1.p1 TRINITY_DN2773_c0_g1~~TRINITY_DN2773_c0_g1_i1.p1  ORF type:complete len:143 (+),score=26.91 TRINITY_DN2773_c0_g1_i1:54-482(+)